MKLTHIIILLVFPIFLFGQELEEPEDIALNNDEFQVYFYESLKQKGIENYDKAITALYRCQQLEPENPVIFFELGKNYLFQKDYLNAYENFKKATELDDKNRWYWAGMYDAAYAQRDYEESIRLLNKLISFKSDYKEELVKLFMYTQQYGKAITLIDELTETVGKSEQREQYRAQILATNRYQGQAEKEYLEGIENNPKDESNYIALIYFYSEKNDTDKAFDIARKLEKAIPNSDWAQVSLFKFHLDKNDGDAATTAMDKILKSHKIDKKIKHRVLNEFLIFAKDKPQFSDELETAIFYFKDDEEVKVAKEVAKFYQNKGDWDNALKYFEMHYKSSPDDVENLILWCNALSQKQHYPLLAVRAQGFTELYPLQPDFYYYTGLALNQQKQYKKALEFLETGIDYIIDNRSLEANFYIQMGEAFHGLDDVKKKEFYFIKADKLLKEIQ